MIIRVKTKKQNIVVPVPLFILRVPTVIALITKEMNREEAEKFKKFAPLMYSALKKYKRTHGAFYLVEVDTKEAKVTIRI